MEGLGKEKLEKYGFNESEQILTKNKEKTKSILDKSGRPINPSELAKNEAVILDRFGKAFEKADEVLKAKIPNPAIEKLTEEVTEVVVKREVMKESEKSKEEPEVNPNFEVKNNTEKSPKIRDLEAKITNFERRVEFFKQKVNDLGISDENREKYKHNLAYTEKVLESMRNELKNSESQTKNKKESEGELRRIGSQEAIEHFEEEVSRLEKSKDFFENKINDKETSDTDREKYQNNLSEVEKSLKETRNILNFAMSYQPVAKTGYRDNPNSRPIGKDGSLFDKGLYKLGLVRGRGWWDFYKLYNLKHPTIAGYEDEGTDVHKYNYRENYQDKLPFEKGKYFTKDFGLSKLAEGYYKAKNGPVFEGKRYKNILGRLQTHAKDYVYNKGIPIFHDGRKQEVINKYKKTYHELNFNFFKDFLGEPKMRELGRLSFAEQRDARNKMVDDILNTGYWHGRKLSFDEKRLIAHKLQLLNNSIDHLNQMEEKYKASRQERTARRRFGGGIEEQIYRNLQTIHKLKKRNQLGDKDEISRLRLDNRQLRRIPHERVTRLHRLIKDERPRGNYTYEKIERRSENLYDSMIENLDYETSTAFEKDLKKRVEEVMVDTLTTYIERNIKKLIPIGKKRDEMEKNMLSSINSGKFRTRLTEEYQKFFTDKKKTSRDIPIFVEKFLNSKNLEFSSSVNEDDKRRDLLVKQIQGVTPKFVEMKRDLDDILKDTTDEFRVSQEKTKANLISNLKLDKPTMVESYTKDLEKLKQKLTSKASDDVYGIEQYYRKDFRN